MATRSLGTTFSRYLRVVFEESSVLIVNTLIGWFYFSVLIFVLGTVLSRWTIFVRVGQHSDFPKEFVDSILLRTAIKGGGFLVAAMLMLFWRQLIAFRDPFVPWREDAWILLRYTSWGSSWVATLLVSGLAAVILYMKGNQGWGLTTFLLLGAGAFPAFSGHANAIEGISWLSLSADILHVWAAAGWLGSLAFLLFLERSWRKYNAHSESLLPSLISKFSTSSMVWVGILVASGILSTSLQLSTASDLLTTGYGRILLIKIVLAIVVMGLGALNWTTVISGFQRAGSLVKLKERSMKEVWFAQLVLLATAILIQWSPSGHQALEHGMNLEMLLIRIIGIGMFFYVAFFILILLFAACFFEKKKVNL